MHDQRVGLVAPAGAQGARDGGRDAAAHGAHRDHLHQHDPREHQRHAGECVGAELRHEPGFDQAGRRLRHHHQHVGPRHPQQRRHDRTLQQRPRARRHGRGRHLVAGADGNGKTPSRVATLMRRSACAPRVRLSPDRRAPLRRFCHSIEAYLRRVRSGATSPGANAYSGALIGRPVAESTMIGSTVAPVSRIDQLHARALGREVLVAPGEQCDQHRTEIAPARGRHVFVARRPLAVAAALQQPGVDQGIEPPRSACWGRCRGSSEIHRSAAGRAGRPAG